LRLKKRLIQNALEERTAASPRREGMGVHPNYLHRPDSELDFERDDESAAPARGSAIKNPGAL